MRIHIKAGLLGLAVSLAGGLAMAQPAFWTREWPVTDFSRKSVEFVEIMGGGPPRDGIPSVDDPVFKPVDQERELNPTEPVAVIEAEGEPARAYPYRYLIWHEIVNDTVGGVPVAVTYCPLCATIIVFERTINGKVTTFGTTGKLRLSNLIMYDRETESWWQQAEGRAIVGELTGQTLTPVISWTESWEEFKARNPDGLVMDSPRAGRPYGSNPYAGYDTSARPFLYNGENPPFGIPPLARVIKVGKRAWPLDRLRDVETLTEAGVTITWKAGQNSALDRRDIGKGRDIGMIRVKDAESGEDMLHDVLFAFAFQAFEPDGEWMIGETR